MANISRPGWPLLIAVIAVVAIGAALLRSGPDQPAKASLLQPGPPRPLPDLRFTDRDGKALSIADFKGKMVLLDIWATWCSPCRAEFPRLDRLQAALGDQGLAVVAVSVDLGGRKPVDQFYQQLEVRNLAEYLDPSGNSAKSLGLRGLPTTLLLDRQGMEIARLEGEAAWDGPAMIALLQKLLASG